MKITVTKEWFRSRAHLEEGREIGAGSLQYMGEPALRPLSSHSSGANASADNVTFGQAVAFMRRHRRWTIERLAQEAEATSEELAAIESNPNFVPELSTVVSLATTFGLPPKAMIHKAGLASTAPCRLHEDSVRDAACPEFKEPLSADEEHVLQAVLKSIVEHSGAQ